MPKYSQRSRLKLLTCDLRLQAIFNEVIKTHDCTILDGHRGEDEQNTAYERGLSKLRYPMSSHNRIPSCACDVAPFPIDWTDLDGFRTFAKEVKRIAKDLDVNVEWGGDWTTLVDMPHGS